MAYSWCRFTIGRDVLERFAGALAIRSKTERETAREMPSDGTVDSLTPLLDAEFAAGAAAALRTIMQMDGEVDPDTFAQMVMAMAGGGE